jgi:GWxTD domain-containing protein
MSVLQNWLSLPAAYAIGWTLIDSIWQGAAIAVALALFLLATRSPRARYAAACLAMLSIAGAFCVTLIRSIPSSNQWPRLPVAALSMPRAFPGFDFAAAGHPNLAAIVPWLTLVWVVGVGMCCAGQFAGWISILRMRRRGVCRAAELWQNEIARLSARLRVSRPVILLESSLAEAPAVLGHFQPLILIPAGLLTGMTAGEIEAILLHELAHVRRADFLMNLFQRLIETLLFYHPAVWWMSKVIRAERENCCDDLVIAAHGNRLEYASALAALERNRPPQPAIAATGGNLMHRIRRILNREPAPARSPLVSAILVTVTLLACVAWQAAPAPAQDDPYKKWLNQEVVYIITNGERAAFERLTTKEEKEKFIEQFWARRDPTPGTPRNEYQEEHYRRIGYVNARFHEREGSPGWTSDRGRIYVVYGPPDEIESHPSGGPLLLYPYDQWLYKFIEGIGSNVTITFGDSERNGQFHMIKLP